MNNKKEIAAEALGEVFPGLDALRVCGYGVLLFLAMTVQTGQASILLGGLALLLALGRAPARRLGAGPGSLPLGKGPQPGL